MSGDRPRSNMFYRITLAPLLMAVVVGLVALDFHFRMVIFTRMLVIFLGLVGLHEFYRLGRARGLAPRTGIGLLFFAVSPMVWCGLEMPGLLHALIAVSPVLFLLAVLLSLLRDHQGEAPAGVVWTVGGYAYLGLFAMIMMFPAPLRAAPEGPFFPLYYFLFLFLCAKGSDMAAYGTGKAFGRHPFAPLLSPRKTWEGALAGMVVGTGAGSLLLVCTSFGDAFPGLSPGWFILVSFLVTAAAQAGDLVESAFKRWSGLKDSGSLLPGFGGVLDMVDSFMIAVPVAWLGFNGLGLLMKGGA